MLISHLVVEGILFTGLNKYYLVHSFTKQKGISPYSYLETIRIGKAKKLLEQRIAPIDVALQTSFIDQSHLGIVTIPVPILKGNREILRELREKLYTSYYDDMIVVDFSDVAQSCNIYSEYLQKASTISEADYTYFGLAICGNKKKVNKLTGSMPLLFIHNMAMLVIKDGSSTL